MASSRLITVFGAIIGIVVLIFAIYAGLTYPRVIVSIPISFTIGADTKTAPFDQPFLDSKAQVEVSIQNGAALWRGQITQNGQIIWEHSAAQGEQQSYNTDWIQLNSGTYNFTFGTIGVGSLNAQVTVTSKGGFW